MHVRQVSLIAVRIKNRPGSSYVNTQKELRINVADALNCPELCHKFILENVDKYRTCSTNTIFLSKDVYEFHILFPFVINKLHNNKLASDSLSLRVYIVQ